MDKNFIALNQERCFFNLDEILFQTAYGYGYEKLCDFRDPYSINYTSSEKLCSIKRLKNHSDTEKNKVKLVLESLGIDLTQYRKGKKYHIPVVVAELIYLSSTEDSYRNSMISRLKIDDVVTFDELSDLHEKLICEIQKDYGCIDRFSKEIQELCNKMLYKCKESQTVMHRTTSAMKSLERLCSNVTVKIYDKELEVNREILINKGGTKMPIPSRDYLKKKSSERLSEKEIVEKNQLTIDENADFEPDMEEVVELDECEDSEEEMQYEDEDCDEGEDESEEYEEDEDEDEDDEEEYEDKEEYDADDEEDGENECDSRNDTVQHKQADQMNTPIYFSRKAAEEGYSFNKLSREEQEMTKKLYISEDAISSFVMAKNMLDEYGAFEYGNRLNVKYEAGLPIDGYFYGYVENCCESRTRMNEYTLKVLINDRDVRCFNFKLSPLDIVYSSIVRDTGIRCNLFHNGNLTRLIGRVVIFKTRNVECKNGGLFTQIPFIRFLNDKEEKLLFKMIDMMFAQHKRVISTGSDLLMDLL